MIEEQWEEYSRMTMPSNASLTQRVETRKAFYAGFASCFASITSVADDSDDQGIVLLESLKRELEQYVQGMRTRA